MYQQPNLIGTNVSIAPNSTNPAQMQPFSLNRFLPKLAQFRAAGNITEYTYDSIKPKKKLKEIRKILFPEKKSFLKIKYGNKFNFKDICVVCGTHHVWESGDFLRPPIPLDKVTKGRPLRGTYCQKHAGIHKQMEMLQQQILAEENGLDFKAFIPKARMPQLMRKGPLTTLSKDDVVSLTATGWVIKPPSLTDSETTMAEIVRLIAEIGLSTERLNHLISVKEE
tara:strand:- start:4002 stop:4673 length:672 start_codon:yes stop_codon:yes gene_type:complete